MVVLAIHRRNAGDVDRDNLIDADERSAGPGSGNPCRTGSARTGNPDRAIKVAIGGR